jgi:hypothetical protein
MYYNPKDKYSYLHKQKATNAVDLLAAFCYNYYNIRTTN